MTTPVPDACDIEIIERTRDESRDGGHGIVVPNEIRINGKPVLAPADTPVVVHGMEIGKHEPVRVTLTLFARVVKVSHETVEDVPA
ncbi:Uncharacterised protein [Mycobacteroides abscessus subsp. abscessus]|nr:Uncharacterised protein [Mycobacteroides abscessus subsp. abscessus]